MVQDVERIHYVFIYILEKILPGGGLEPPRVTPYAPQTYASASSAIPANTEKNAGIGRDKLQFIFSAQVDWEQW